MHLPDADGVRQPLTHCKIKDNPSQCKSGFPKLRELLAKAIVVCGGMAEAMDLAVSGRRNQVGSLLGPRSDEWLDGTHPALLAALRCNSDVQLPYRFPITRATHAATVCGAECVTEGGDEKDIIFAAQSAQDAQAGYACDYQNKRGPVAVNEINEWQKGHKDLVAKVRDEKVT